MVAEAACEAGIYIYIDFSGGDGYDVSAVGDGVTNVDDFWLQLGHELFLGKHVSVKALQCSSDDESTPGLCTLVETFVGRSYCPN